MDFAITNTMSIPTLWEQKAQEYDVKAVDFQDLLMHSVVLKANVKKYT